MKVCEGNTMKLLKTLRCKIAKKELPWDTILVTFLKFLTYKQLSLLGLYEKLRNV